MTTLLRGPRLVAELGRVRDPTTSRGRASPAVRDLERVE
jgi:hypothetical protein